MQQRFIYKKVEWIDLHEPDRHELLALAEEHGLALSTIDHMMISSSRPRILKQDGYFHMILHFPGDVFGNERVTEGTEIHFLIGAEFFITVHRDHSDALYTFKKTFETASTLGSLPSNAHGGHLFDLLLQHFYVNIADEIDEMNDAIARVEKNIFNRKEAKMIKVLADINRSLLVLRRTLQFHGDILESLSMHTGDVFDQDFAAHIDRLVDEHTFIERMIHSTKEILDDVKESGQLLLTNRTNNFVMILTMVAFITVPISLTAEFISLDLDVPFINSSSESLYALLIAAGVGILLFVWSRYKKWI
jgi:Mg2+ and Co2+ transporter CorA